MTLETALWEIICGSVAGALGKLIDYPFDTIKVRMQTQGTNVFPTTWSCIYYTYHSEGLFKGFYQGITSPLVGAILENATLFVSYNQCYNLLINYTSWSIVIIIMISGAFAGSCASLVLTPIELIKCHLQVSNLKMSNLSLRNNDEEMIHLDDYDFELDDEMDEEENDNDNDTIESPNDNLTVKKLGNARERTITQSLHDDDNDDPHPQTRQREEYDHTAIIPTIRSIIKEKGIGGLWQGQMGTFVRESIGSLIWFATFELLKMYFIHHNTGKWETHKKSISTDDNSMLLYTWQLLISGGIAGFTFNGSVFPVDTIKSIMQTEHLGFKDAIHYINDHYGFKGFYRGLIITLIRSFPSNAVVFYAHETLANLL